MRGALLAVALLGALAGPAPAATIRIGPAAAGSTVRLRVGDTLVVALPANPSTGYAWSRAPLAGAALRAVGATYTPPRSARLGAAGTFAARYAARAAGRARVALAYTRRWERGRPPARTFAVTVLVRG